MRITEFPFVNSFMTMGPLGKLYHVFIDTHPGLLEKVRMKLPISDIEDSFVKFYLYEFWLEVSSPEDVFLDTSCIYSMINCIVCLGYDPIDLY